MGHPGFDLFVGPGASLDGDVYATVQCKYEYVFVYRGVAAIQARSREGEPGEKSTFASHVFSHLPSKVLFDVRSGSP